jgi:uncharacterized protein (DUF983 family)
MSSIICARCGSQVPLRRFYNPAGKPFCVRCGWNLDRAQEALAGKSTIVKLIPFVIVGVLLFVAFTTKRADLPFDFLIPGLFALVALVPLWSYYSDRKAIEVAKSTANPCLAQSQSPLDPSLQMLQSMPRPRQVRFRFVGNSGAIVVVFSTFVILTAILYVAISRRPFSAREVGWAPFFFKYCSCLW